MTEREKMVVTIAKACGWPILDDWLDPDCGIEVHYNNGPESFNPFTSESDWFRAFDAMGLGWMRMECELYDVWKCELSWVSIRVGYADDRLTAMALALHAAAWAKLGGGGGMKARIEVFDWTPDRWQWKIRIQTPDEYLYLDAGGSTQETKQSAREEAEKVAKMLGLEVEE